MRLNRKPRAAGFTFTEMMATVLILGVIAAPLAKLINSSVKGLVHGQAKVESLDAFRTTFDRMERDLGLMVQVAVTDPQHIELIQDSNRIVGYNPGGDFDLDGFPNQVDADDDNDKDVILPPAEAWKAGDDLRDDDDDNDGNVDLQVRYRLIQQNKILVREIKENGGAWGRATVLLKGVTLFKLTYFGSKTEALGADIDWGEDGIDGVIDPGEDDQLITEDEIDRVLPIARAGYNNDLLDDPAERQYVCSIEIELAQDVNQDGTQEFQLKSTVTPALLPLRRD